jgi:hypothetical protein
MGKGFYETPAFETGSSERNGEEREKHERAEQTDNRTVRAEQHGIERYGVSGNQGKGKRIDPGKGIEHSPSLLDPEC